MKTSILLSQDHNNHPLGMRGGRVSADINPKGHNERAPIRDEDMDGKPDVSVSEELSEDTNRVE